MYPPAIVVNYADRLMSEKFNDFYFIASIDSRVSSTLSRLTLWSLCGDKPFDQIPLVWMKLTLEDFATDPHEAQNEKNRWKLPFIMISTVWMLEEFDYEVALILQKFAKEEPDQMETPRTAKMLLTHMYLKWGSTGELDEH